MSSAAAIVRSIRTATDEGEEFDLAGAFTESMSRDLIKSAFGEPLAAASKPLKFTFVVGGGRLVRSRYDTELPKWLTGELRTLGYDDDRGASLGSQGAFKRQHDTDANLEYLHVFPKLAKSAAGSSSGAAGAPDAGAAAPASVNRESPEYMVVACTLAQLQRLVPARVATYAGKKRLLGVLQEYDRTMEGLDNKMMATAQPLLASEQEAYDVTTREALGEKVAWLQGDMKAQVAAGKLTAAEKEKVLAGMDDKLQQARAELAAATASGQAKKAAALQASIEQLGARRASLASAPAITHPVRGDAEMRKCEVGIANVDRLRANITKAGRLATLAEARELGTRSDHEEKLAVLRGEARLWFETDEEFDVRCATALRALAAKGRR